MAKLIGNAPNQVPTNADLGELAFLDKSFVEVSGGTSWQSTIVTGTTLTAVAGNGYFINTTSNACTVTLPGSASIGDQVQIVDYAGTFATNSITLTSSLKINGGTDDKMLNTNREGVTITYADATQGWVATSGVNSGDQAIDPQTYSADFLVIAGGGSGGRNGGGTGGGGAGGYRNSYSTETSGGGGSSETALSFSIGTTYTITVGAGGAAQTTFPLVGNSGSNSSISGTDITTITLIGGGGGGGNGDAGSGGCGGGGGETSPRTGGSGTANQGYAGGEGGAGGYGAGGGGTGAIGSAGSTSGNGGNGTASTITGSSVTRGGGGGGSRNETASGVGGSGGGGNGGTGAGPGSSSTPGINATANTGGGGGGVWSTNNASSGTGGSGVVILRMPTANYTGTTSGSPTVSTSGTDTILIYNASGSYTA